MEKSMGPNLLLKVEKLRVKILFQHPSGNKDYSWKLFYNTPARLKYMKSLQAELAHIVDVVNRLSLVHPEVALHLA